MKKTGFKIKYLLIAGANIFLLLGSLVVMWYVQVLLMQDVRINLTEIVTQNKDVINSKLLIELNNLETVAQQISERALTQNKSDNETIRNILLDYAEQYDDTMLCWSDSEGNATYGTGEQVNIAGRKYFQLAIAGKQNISERTVSRLNGDDIFVISVPLVYNKEIIGTVQRQYTPEEMYDLCTLSLFSQKGTMHIINSDGYVLISSQAAQNLQEASNYYRMVFESDPKASQEIERNIRQNKSGFIEMKLGGQNIFSSYTPIEELHDWFLITSINRDAIIPNANIVVKMFYVILFVVVLCFSASTFYLSRLRKKQQDKLEKLAFIDPITNDMSYTKFAIEVGDFLRNYSGQAYVMSFDIDNFKYINKVYGFEKGDIILKYVCNVYKKRLNQNEYLARNVADHFVVFLTDNSKERMQNFFSPELLIDEIKVYFSAGIYEMRDKTESINLMLDKATLASQKAKGQKYKEVEIYTTEYDNEITNNENIKRKVETAVLQDDIIPFFQPKVNINTNKLVGAEALARWITKEGKMISPAEFIPVCERTGIITLVDWTIFEKTLQFLKRNLQNNSLCVPISVNFSRAHLLNADFVEILGNKLKQYNVPGKYIEIELTETVIFDNSKNINDFINKLHKLGVLVSMDDFGSGYSSLHMLKDVDIDVLKIDKAFVQGTVNSEKQQIIFNAIISMSKSLNIKIVVEGVENLENINLMKAANCEIAQGFYYSKPIIAEDFQIFLTKGVIEK